MDLGSCEHNDVIQINENSGKYKHKNDGTRDESFKELTEKSSGSWTTGVAEGKLTTISMLKSNKFYGW